MELFMEPVRKYDDLFGEDMARKLGAALAERAAVHSARRDADFARARAWAEAGAAPLVRAAGAENLDAALRPVVKDMVGIEHPESPKDVAVPRGEPAFPLLATPHSCVTSFGPYNSWGEAQGGGAGEAVLHNGPGAHRLGGQVRYAFAGSGNVTGGAGCWFNVSPRSTANLKLAFVSNAHCYLGLPLGYSSGSISLHGAVWGANANGWVDSGGAGVDLVRSYLVAAWSVRDYTTRLGVSFDASSGGAFFCSGWFSVWAGSGGLSGCNVSLATMMDFLTVCTD